LKPPSAVKAAKHVSLVAARAKVDQEPAPFFWTSKGMVHQKILKMRRVKKPTGQYVVAEQRKILSMVRKQHQQLMLSLFLKMNAKCASLGHGALGDMSVREETIKDCMRPACVCQDSSPSCTHNNLLMFIVGLSLI
jgi:hypothetical protein